MALMQLDLPAPVAPAIKQVRHLGEVHHHRAAGDVLAESDLERMGGRAGLGAGQDVAQRNQLALAVRHLDADGRATRNRRQDPHVGRRHRIGDVLVEAGDPGDFHAGAELEFVAGDRRTHGHADNRRLDSVGGKRVLERSPACLEHPAVDLHRLGFLQQRHRRKPPRAATLGGTKVDLQLFLWHCEFDRLIDVHVDHRFHLRLVLGLRAAPPARMGGGRACRRVRPYCRRFRAPVPRGPAGGRQPVAPRRRATRRRALVYG